MVIEVRYQTKQDAKNPHTQLTSTQYFECDEIPNRDAVARRLRSTGVDFDENTISINPREDDDAETMRDGGIPILPF
ncbi:MAG TPA: hypothetical protein VK208_09710 [Pyrinomonadaceae bacterium]|jgi:hypothetical protein|nr:hypothetical protein [Pyrinomonadaceae bacterium]